MRCDCLFLTLRVLIVAASHAKSSSCDAEAHASSDTKGTVMLQRFYSTKVDDKIEEEEREKVRAREWELFQLLNQLRAQGFTCPGDFVFAANSKPLLFDCRLWRASYLHSQDMADNDYTGHNSKDGRTPVDRAQAQGVPPWEHRNAENLATGPSGAQAVLDGWKSSSAHCRTMMHPDVRMFGAGYASNSASYWHHYWTQMLSWSSTGLDDSCYPESTTR